MAPSSAISCSRQRKHSSLERRPGRMLKDFLLDDSNSCSSNGFKSFPRKPDSSVRNLIQIDLNSGHAKQQKLQRSRSKAASTTISAFQAMINAVVKNIHFASVKYSPSILPRSLSRKLSKRNSQLNNGAESDDIKNITVRVKDIIRWKSFRDLAEEKSRPSDFASSPHHQCTTTTATTTTTGSTCTPCSSNGSSWCDSDFTSECLPSEEYGENEDHNEGKKLLPYVGKDPTETVAAKTAVGPKGTKYASEELHSPVSVLEFESLPKLEPVNLEKWMSTSEEEETNEVEEMARQLLNRVIRETSSLRNEYQSICIIENLLLDLFREEIVGAKLNIQTRNEELERHMVGVAKAWINGEQSETTKWGVGEKREGCVRDMEREGRWSSKYEEEQQDLACQVESGVMNILVDELLADLLL